MINYDVYARDLIEQQILSTIISLSAYNKVEDIRDLIINTHGINNHEYFASAMNQSVFIAILRCWENNVQADLSMVCTFKPKDVIASKNYIHMEGNSIAERGSIHDLDADYKHFDHYIIDISMKWLSETNLQKTIFVHKQYVLMDYWNAKAKDITAPIIEAEKIISPAAVDESGV